MYHPEQHKSPAGARLNWLRASVLGANDGIVSIAGLVFGVAGASLSEPILLSTGIAGIIAGALSMAIGEYVSVSSSRDSERALLKKEERELREYPAEELQELIGIYEKKGLSRTTATTVAQELTAHDAFAAHAEAELKISPNELTNPTHAALASALSFTVGAILPLVAILLPPESVRIPVAAISVLVLLALTGALGAYAGGASITKASIRVVVGGALAMALTYGIGSLIGSAL